MEKVVNTTIMTLARGNPDGAAKVFDLEGTTELLKRNPHAEFKIPNVGGIKDFDDLERFIRSVLRLQVFRVQHSANLFKDDSNNVVALYAEVFGCLCRFDLAMTGVGFFKSIVAQCKKDMKLYWNMPVQTLDKHVESIISELRTIFTTYKANQINKGVLLALNNLFWFYFQINQFQQCTFLVRPIKDQIDSLLVGTEKSYIVTFYYYFGKLKIYEGQHREAAEYLERAFQMCHKKFAGHRVKILRLLVPFKMMCGYMPSKRLIEEHGLQEYLDLMEAVRRGDLKMLEVCKQKYKRQWIKRGIYFLVDNLELILIRRLFKLVWLLNEKKTILSTELFQRALNFRSTYKFDIYETENIVGNLIMKGYIRASVFPEQKKTVFPAENAFPPLVSQ